MMRPDLGLPWAVAPLEGKYYGTRIIDRHGEEIMKFAGRNRDDDGGEPSARWYAKMGRDFVPDDWQQHTCLTTEQPLSWARPSPERE